MSTLWEHVEGFRQGPLPEDGTADEWAVLSGETVSHGSKKAS